MSKGKLAVLATAIALIATALIPTSAGAAKLHRAVSLGTTTAWAPAGSATVHPGVQVFTQGAQCTSNFLFRDGGGTYIGQAAHCSGTGAATDTNGCDSGSLPLGTQAESTALEPRQQEERRQGVGAAKDRGRGR